ncbi:hypothetical protein JF781_21735 [Mycobacterium sp. WUMAC-067]|uniref:hypothetical protein n=1 Tax=unclassified Mycobacterium TaxID=2642494 RepID=UPI001D2CEFB2|nr:MULTISPECIES: hypothetical protein [unclassified Mycobacterium]MCA2244981.1 hypothetical protein [Mycobacterium sp. WUMAC-067]MCA2316402.1 hypothetical protein [Mycobacterium sp. WUMAC-025]
MNADVRQGPTARGPLLLARASTALMVVLALVQAILAGDFLGGQYDALMLHALVARAITITSAVQVVILAWIWRLGGPRGAFLGGVAQTLLLVAEFAAGELRLTAVHIPLGVLLVAGIVQVAMAIWRTPLPARRPAAGEVTP